MSGFRIILMALIVLALTGCGLSTPVKLPRVSTYTITNLRFLSTPKRLKTNKTLLVNLPVADSGYDSTNMVYIQSPYKLRAFANNRWVAPPANMLLPLLAQSIRTVGYFKAVVTSPFSGITNYRLETRLLKLQQEFIRPISLVRLVMQATLINNATSRVIASRRFQVMVSAPENNPYSGVLATNKASNILCKRISRFVLRSSR